MEIIPCTVSEEILPLFAAYRSFYGREDEEEKMIAYLRSVESYVFVAQRDNEKIGFAQIFFTYSSTRMCRDWILNDLFVWRKNRGQGVGRALALRCIEESKKAEVGRLYLKTEQDNLPATALYRSLGFKQDTQFDHYYFQIN